jgi:hypothetical protein
MFVSSQLDRRCPVSENAVKILFELRITPHIPHSLACLPANKNSKSMVSSWMLRRVALVRTDVSEEPSTSYIRVTRISELGRTLAVTNNRRKM